MEANAVDIEQAFKILEGGVFVPLEIETSQVLFWLSALGNIEEDFQQ